MLDWKTPDRDSEDNTYLTGANSDPFFKLLACSLAYHMQEGYPVEKIVMLWHDIIKERHAKIKSADELWNDVKDDIGEEALIVIKPLLENPPKQPGMSLR